MKKKGLPFVRFSNLPPKGSGAYWHELRHVEQERRWRLCGLTGFFDHLFIALSPFVLVLDWFRFPFVLLLFVNHFVCEWDADFYAIKKVGFIQHYLHPFEPLSC